MSNKEVVSTIKDDKQEPQKQFGCMNGILQIFLLGQRRHGNNQKTLYSGESNNGETEVMNDKENSPKVVTKEKNSLTIESPRKSVSSSSSSTAVSTSDCSKRPQTELPSFRQSIISGPSSSTFLQRKQPDLFIKSPDIRDVAMDSITREPRMVSVKTVVKDERVRSRLKHVDSPRPYAPQKPIEYERIVKNLKDLRETARFSCDERGSRYELKSNMKIKELPRLSLDSRQSYISNSSNDPMSNKRASSSVVARLMGLEALTPSIDESKTSKTNSEESVFSSKLSGKEEEIMHDCTSVSPRVHKPQRAVNASHVLTKISLEAAPWKQEGGGWVTQKPTFKSTEGPSVAEPRSIYDEIENRLTKHEYKTAGKDLRALKQILEAMQKTKKRLESKQNALDDSSIDDILSHKVDQPVSPTIPQQKVKHSEGRQVSLGRNRLKDTNAKDRKVTVKQMSTSNFPECSSGTVSPRMRRSTDIVNGPTSDLSRHKKQPGMQRKAKYNDSLQDSNLTRNSSQQTDTASLQSENDSEVTSTKSAQEVDYPFTPKENHRTIITERLTEDKSTFDQAKQTAEQPSPVSVLDAFYTEDTPSPVNKKVTAFNDDENCSNLDHYFEFIKMKQEKRKNLIHQIELLNTNTDYATVNQTVTSLCEDETGDQRYIEEIISASGCLRDLDRTTASFINPELFHHLEKTKTCTEEGGYNKKFMTSKVRRKLVFDTVNDVIGHKLAMIGPLVPHKGRNLNADKLLTELCSEIDSLQNKSALGVSDEDDEVINIINADVTTRSQDWDEYCYQVPGLVLDIERLIFKDLICEAVSDQITSLQGWPVRSHCRQLFPM